MPFIPSPTTPITWLIDASIYIFRPWFVPDQSVDAQGMPIHAVRGFLRFVYQLLYTEQPQYIAFAFDGPSQFSIRKQLYPAYKAHRPSAPSELKYQFQLCRDFLQALGVVTDLSSAYEADDVIGTWVMQQRALGHACHIITGDKDLAQLVGNNDVWWDYGQRKALNHGAIKKQFGVWPAQIADQLALSGDKTDNIPGLNGVGMATAAKLLQRFTSCEELIARQTEIGSLNWRNAKQLQRIIAEGTETIRLAKQLSLIRCDVPDLTTDLQRRPKDLVALARLCTQLGLSEEQYALWAAI